MSVVGFVSCLPPGLHPGMDALAFGLAEELTHAGTGLRLFPADLRGAHASISEKQSAAVDRAIAEEVSAIVLFVLDMREPAAAVARALARRVPVIAIHKPAYPVSASIVVPNYHQGVVLGQALARSLESTPGERRVVILGGPEIVDDVELVRGAVDGVRGSGLQLLNDPFLPKYRNLDDVRGAGRRAAEALLDDYYPFEGWVVFNDETLLDAVSVLEARKLAGKVRSVSRNGTPEIIRLLRDGRTDATFDYRLPELGKLAARVALRFLRREAPPDDSLFSADVGTLFTRQNVSRYVPWNQRAAEVELAVSR